MKPWLGCAAAVLAVLPATAWAQAPAGSNFQVNVYTTGAQRLSTVATDAHGNFIVVWNNVYEGQLVGRRFNPLGVPQGGEFEVSTSTGLYGVSSVVSAAADGRFVVVWHNEGDGSGYGIFGRRFDAAGVAQGGEFQVNTYTTGMQARPDVTMDPAGNFVVAWQSYTGFVPFDGNEVLVRRYDSAGAPVGDPFLVHQGTTAFGNETSPSIDSDDAGNFVVAWSDRSMSVFPPTTSTQMFARRFDASGAPLGGRFSVPASGGSASAPHLAVSGNGDFAVVWGVSSGFPIPTSSALLARSFAADGTPLNDGFVVETNTTGRVSSPSIDADQDGNFVIAWEQAATSLGIPDIAANRFDRDGTKLAVEYQVNTYTTNNQLRPAVASTRDENFVVIWDSGYQDGSQDGLFAQRYGDLIFRDGVETGDVSRWSSVQADDGDLAVTNGSAMGGTSFGLRALVDDTNPLFVQDDSPSAENVYRAQFRFDPNGFDPGEANGRFRVRMFIAFDESNRRIVTLVLRRIGGAYSVMARVRLSDGSRANTPFVPVTDNAHFINFEWIRASSPDAEDGRFRMFLDGFPFAAATLSDLDNDANTLESARLGALTVKPGASGTLLYDEFESRRTAIFIIL